MGKGKAPKAPDPMQTALAQNKLNQSTAGLSQIMSMIDQVGPDGSQTYTQSGYRDYVDPFTGRTTKIPNYVQTTKLSDAQQLIKDRQDAGQANIAGLLERLSGQFNGTLDKPFSLDNKAVEDSIIDRYSSRMSDRFAREAASEKALRLARGIRDGSAADDRAVQNQYQKENDAWNELFINARDQAVNEKLTERNQPLNEFASLLSGGQIDQPMFGSTPGANVANTDYAGLTQQNYQNELAAYQRKQDNFNNGLGALFGVGAKAIMYSDRRLKADVKKVGKTDDGQNIYSYRYRGGKRMHLGLMAQEVEKKHPDAVTKDSSGYRMVDYSIALHLGA
ncbi:tail fiber domain-containing protein [Taklimakanibacter albus]|uniref:Tail fiber domain-containing protein n=1 Tax=Taklimakanibacter albus TaxID=2800327 RepID=A0ACC5RBK2_9HYPH|nr:tail fiber domain-containing protein [Aestuariivirga sp. YIM B02566]MBK1870076.1 tail fiber domain-containing protein [Aestuariivirga sp. YIM B02566]